MLASGPASRLLRLHFAALNPRQVHQHVQVSLFRTGRIATKDRRKRFSASAAADTVELVKELKLISGAHCIPHPDKAATGGEDAHFVSTTGGGTVGVADGVGGWADSGISPADYSRGFMKVVESYLDGEPLDNDKKGDTSPQMKEEQRNDLRGAFEAAHAALRIPGSCTACVMQLDKEEKRLLALNLGDSGFMLVRKGRLIFKSPPMQHFFDCPCQFGAYPEYVDMTDRAEDAEDFAFRAKPGDIVVMGTDGLWDNCPDEEILGLLPKGPEGVVESASLIAQRALEHSQDERFDSPYCQSAREQGFDLTWYEKLLGTRIINGRLECGKIIGGKWDDITVVTAFVDSVPVKIEPPPEPEIPETVSEQNSDIVSENNSVNVSEENSS
ncbi:hypothetical protein BSKO_06123 [Bryopsis sp. KO-2023]|nr:hypothetical protein BSKO_06123 [Bryopsis sp. KO-2023]